MVRCDALDTSPVAPMSARFVRELAAESFLFAVRFGLVRAFVSFVLFRLQCDDTENRLGTESAPLQTRCGQQERCNSTVNWLCHAAGSLSIKEGTHARAHKESEYQFPCNHL